MQHDITIETALICGNLQNSHHLQASAGPVCQFNKMTFTHLIFSTNVGHFYPNVFKCAKTVSGGAHY